MLFEDNKSSILIEMNGRKSAGKRSRIKVMSRTRQSSFRLGHSHLR